MSLQDWQGWNMLAGDFGSTDEQGNYKAPSPLMNLLSKTRVGIGTNGAKAAFHPPDPASGALGAILRRELSRRDPTIGSNTPVYSPTYRMPDLSLSALNSLPPVRPFDPMTSDFGLRRY